MPVTWIVSETIATPSGYRPGDEIRRGFLRRCELQLQVGLAAGGVDPAEELGRPEAPGERPHALEQLDGELPHVAERVAVGVDEPRAHAEPRGRPAVLR